MQFLSHFSYCMRKNLVEIPDYWFCETCQSKNGTTSPCEVKQDIGLQVSARKQSFRTGPTGKVKYLHEDEVIKLSSCNTSMKSTPGSSTLPMTKKASSTLPITRRAHVAYKSVVPKSPSLTVKPNSNIAPMAHGKFPRNGVLKNPMNDQHASSLKGDKFSTSLVQSLFLQTKHILPPVTIISKSNYFHTD